MTTLKTLYQIGKGYGNEVTRACVMLEINQDRQATADVLCALLEGERKLETWTVMTTPVVDEKAIAHNQALTLAQDIIRATLTAS